MAEFVQSEMKVINPITSLCVKHYDHYLHLEKLVNEHMPVYRPYGVIEGAYVHNEDEFKLLSEYFGVAKSYNGRIEIANNYFREEPDWYFLEGEDGGREYPATWNFQTLSERKAEFQKFCDHLKELEKSK